MKHKRVPRMRPVGPRGFTEWIQPVKKGYLMVCCDCGLAHEMEFRVSKDAKPRAQFRARRAERYTRKFRAQSRQK